MVKRDIAPKHQDRDIEMQWGVKLSDLAEATRAGCAFCSFILDRFFHHNRMWLRSADPPKPWYRDDTKDHPHRLKAVEHALEIVSGLENDAFLFSVSTSHAGGKALPDFNKILIEVLSTEHHSKEVTQRLFHINHATLEAYTVQGDPAAGIVTTRPPGVVPASEESFKIAHGWLKTCLETHSRCGPAIEAQLPTRIIDISDPIYPRLDVSRAKGRYAALSYCWGGPQDFAAREDTVRKMIQGFHISDLPQTLQDAVLATRELGLRYLWVDSLCILQDSPDDKEHEVSRMAQIYKDAVVTICAASTDSVKSGFLKDRSDSDTGLSKDLFPMAYRVPKADAENVRAALQEQPHGWGTLWVREAIDYDVTWEPVTNRAWTLQERLLSPRFLHYGSRTIWECREMQGCDGGIESQANDLLGRDGGGHLASLSYTTSHMTLFSLMQLFDTWYRIVNDYTRRHMSLASDILPAIGGIAAELSRASGVSYKAGLWENNLVHDLMWTSNSKERFTRPKPWRAPTWSWASVDSVVSYDAITPDAVQEAEVIDCSVQPLFPDSPFGEVQNGSLRIRAPFSKIPREDIIKLLQSQALSPAPPQSNDAAEWNRMMLAHFRSLRNSNLPDQDEADTSSDDDASRLPDDIYCIILFTRHWKHENFGEIRVDRPCYFGLLLAEKTGQDGSTFERLGGFDNEECAWLQGCTRTWPRETITLV